MMKKGTLAAHNIRVLFWADLFGSVKFIQPVLALFYFSRGLDEALILWVMFCWSFGVLVGEVPTSMLADRYGAKRAFLLGSVFSIISHAMLLGADEPWLFFMSNFLSGFAASCFSGADEALIYESLKASNEEHLMDRAMGIIQSAQFVVTVAALVIGALVAKDLTNGQFNLLIVLGIVFQCVRLALVFLVKNPLGHGAYRGQPLSQVKEGILAIRQAPQVLWMFLNVTLVFIPTTAIFENFSDKLLYDAGLPVSFISVVLGSLAVFSFVVSRSIGWLTTRFSRIGLMHATGALGVLALVIVALDGDALFSLFGAMVALRFVRTVRYPVYSQLSNDLIPSHVRATTISLLSIVDSLCDMLIFSSVGALATMGFSYLFLASAAVALIGCLMPIRSVSPQEKRQ
ncbi:MFS transporter [Geobacillus kaustophilus]|uniref:MFS transporter n=1 Tax=Geobacillus kaustophilus TaxID=1462 RepID=UPI0027DD54ED|nr:MFS transporter [Geobacillus kaustophilus]WMJ18739.1 MFS transporter [Geobacillus kaustophilus]